MDTLRKGHAGKKVMYLQELLKSKQLQVAVDGVFGTQTYLAVCKFQQMSALPSDGVVGAKTWNALQGNKDLPVESNKPESYQETTTSDPAFINYEEAARILIVEETAIRAVSEIESGGRGGFLKDGRPQILFEGHIFWRELQKRNIDPVQYVAGNEDILFSKWNKDAYKGGTAEYERLNRAIAIHEEAALCSASWGMFQIMGFNYRLCGYTSVREYVDAIKSSRNNHLMSFMHFLRNTGLDTPIRELDWAKFAEKYNGPGYKQNQYDKKLADAYKKFEMQ